MDALEICFTGFAKQQRKDLEELATESSFIVRKAATKNLHILCAGGNAGPKKVATAKADGAVILSPEGFIQLVRTGEISSADADKLSKLLNGRNEKISKLQDEQYLSLYQGYTEHDLKLTLLSNLQSSIKLLTHPSIKFTEPAEVTVSNSYFCFTGDFKSGERSLIHAFTRMFNGFIDEEVTLKSKYLVVGGLGSEQWANENHGRKIEKAIMLKESGHKVHIISEDQWLIALMKN
ncbi:BRCT domain-containing protein [Shewanella sp. YLB-07]|uniref:BRCT domain-containing protein n=1 Tax=Shewanella sp. YLB-07 TaxID=2601268 RepID=UPI00128E7A34|nr:BRCT domain-containing protein [Shewanella sp. YLB-07]MPY25153.1 hypothetical protein [Shewanella sp. YLB-07]